LQVDVIGSQWSWRFEYPEYDIISTDLMLPVNKQALLRLSSTDVIHSFWIPEFRVKQDVLPSGEEFVRELRITPTELGTYKVRCAELCGSLHYDMRSPVVVMTQADFDSWIEEQSSSEVGDPAERGRIIAEQYGCIACHSADGLTIVGPTWQGLFGNQEALSDGTSVLVDAEYLYESIRDPGAKITDGFQNIMPPNIGADLSDEQIDDIIAYIESLQ
jgi:cytochrome c oxidase subunit 2